MGKTDIEKQNKYFRLFSFINENGLTRVNEGVIYFNTEGDNINNKSVFQMLENLRRRGFLKKSKGVYTTDLKGVFEKFDKSRKDECGLRCFKLLKEYGTLNNHFKAVDFFCQKLNWITENEMLNKKITLEGAFKIITRIWIKKNEEYIRKILDKSKKGVFNDIIVKTNNLKWN